MRHLSLDPRAPRWGHPLDARHACWAARRGAVATNGFTPLIDAKAAGELLGVPHTWLLAQARAGRIPHHRLGHYVRFNADDLGRWLQETRSGPQLDETELASRP